MEILLAVKPKSGDKPSLQQTLLDSLLLESANDAAVALAKAGASQPCIGIVDNTSAR